MVVGLCICIPVLELDGRDAGTNVEAEFIVWGLTTSSQLSFRGFGPLVFVGGGAAS